MEHLLLTLAMIDHELAERALMECRSDIEECDEERCETTPAAYD